MKLVEKLSNITSLSSQERTSCFNDYGIQSQALRDVDSGGGSGHSYFQFVGGLQSGFVKADRGVDHAGGVCPVDFQRSVVGGDYRHAADACKVRCDGYGQGC